MSWFWIIMVWALCAGIAATICQAKNRPNSEGLILGGLLGVIGIIIVLCLPKLPPVGMTQWPAALPPPGWYQDPADPN